MIDVGLIGYGLGGRRFHAPVIAAVPGLRLAAILQRTGDEAAREHPTSKIVRTLEELLAIDSLRLIVICTPNQTHFPMAKQCLQAGRDVVVDKPFTSTLAEAAELYRIAHAHNRLLTVYHNRRFDADFQAIQQLVSAGALGEIVRFENSYDRYRPSPKPHAWREKPGPGSGVLFDLGPHLIDQALTLFGVPEFIAADIRTERPHVLTDDAFDVFFHYPKGFRAHLRATMLCLRPRPRFQLFGSTGAYIKKDFDPLELTLRSGAVPADDAWMLEKEENWGELTTAQPDGQTTQRKVPSVGDWRQFYANFRDAILGKAKLLVTREQVLEVMSALELARQSSDTGSVLPWRALPDAG